jgi:FkbM family methyltransferase
MFQMNKLPWKALKKISFYNQIEKYQIIRYAIGCILVNKTPKGIKTTYNFTNNLVGKGIKFRRVGCGLQFHYPVNCSNEKFEIKIESSDSLVFDQIIVNEEYKAIRSLLSKYAIVPKNMIDAGANIGLTSRYFNAFYPQIEIIALEPSKETFNRLKRNVELGNLKKIHLLKKGLWNTETFLKADNSFKDGQDWAFRLVESKDNEIESFPTTTIQAIMGQFGMRCVDFLKIDVEGAEVEIFKNPLELDWLQRVKILAIEIHDEFECRKHIEKILDESFVISKSGEITIGIHKSIVHKGR